MTSLEKEITEAITSTLVIENKESIKFTLEKLVPVLEAVYRLGVSKGINQAIETISNQKTK